VTISALDSPLNLSPCTLSVLLPILMHFLVFFLGLLQVPFLPSEDANRFHSQAKSQLQEKLCCVPATQPLPNSDLLPAHQLAQPGWSSDTKPARKPLQGSVPARGQRGRQPGTGETRPGQQVPAISFPHELNLISCRDVNSRVVVLYTTAAGMSAIPATRSRHPPARSDREHRRRARCVQPGSNPWV